jgi:hypothetical protein
MNAKAVLAAFAGVILLSSAALRAEDPAAQPAPAAAAAPEVAVPPTPRVFGGVVAESIHVTATVESIDYLTREIILKSDKGEREAMTLGDQVKRITDIHKGDTVEIVYAESVSVLVAGVGTTPARDENVSVQRAGSDQNPGAVVTKTTRILATIEALDYTARTATLKGPHKTVTINVGPEAVNFDKVKVGDSVYLEYTQAIAAAVTKHAPVEAPAPAK